MTSNDLTPEELWHFKPKFTNIYSDEGKEINPIPEGVKVTVFIDAEDWENIGFVCDVLAEDMGLEQFIAKSWILESDLQLLINKRV